MTQYIITGEPFGTRAQLSPYSLVATANLGVGQTINLTLSAQDEATLIAAGILQLYPGAGAYRGAWQPNWRYDANDVVLFAGSLYEANAAFTSGASFNAANWTQIAGGGGGGGSIATASDAAVSAPARGQSLRYNGTKWANEGEGVFYASDYGVLANGKTVTDAAITAGQATLSSASAAFTSADVGKLVVVVGAGATATAALSTTILSVSGGVATLAASAGTTVSGAECFYATNDTTACQACLTAAAAVNGTAIFPHGDMGLSATLTTGSGPLSIRGQGAKELYGTGGGNNTWNFPTQAPYLTGTVFVQCAPNVDGILSAAQGNAQHMKDFGIRFAGRFQATGHGLNSTPAAWYGNQGGSFENVRVFGVDGNHYGFVFSAPIYNRHTGLRSYGGGGMRISVGSAPAAPGNLLCLDYFSCTYIAGSAHGVYINGTTFDFMQFVRMQSWVFTPNPALPNTTPPSGQNCIQTDGVGGTYIGFVGADIESNVAGESSTFPNGVGCYRTHGNVSTVGNANPTGNPSSGASNVNASGTTQYGSHQFLLTPAATATANTTLNGATSTGATAIVVASATGFATGQCIQIDSGATTEIAIISSVAGATLNLLTAANNGLSLAHATGVSVQAGAAMVLGQVSNGGFPSANRVGAFSLPIGAAPQHHTISFLLLTNWNFRLDYPNAIRAWSTWLTSMS